MAPGPDDRTTIVLVTMDRRREVLETLERLLALPERAPLIMVDNASADGTADAVRAMLPRVTVIALPANQGAAGRNAGVRAAQTPYVAFADDDSWWAPGAIARVGDVLDAWPALGAIASRTLVGPRQRPDPVSTMMAASPLPDDDALPGPAVLGFVACGAAVRRDAFLAVGGFSDLLDGVGGEEGILAMDLAMAGWGLAYVDDIVTHHHPSAARDRDARRRSELVNGLVAAWLHRPASLAWGRLADLAEATAAGDAVAARALQSFGPRLPDVLTRRRVVPEWLEERAQLLESRPTVELMADHG